MSTIAPLTYLDNNATTQVSEGVLDAMLPFYRQTYGNPSSMHRFGGEVGLAIKQARYEVAALIGAEPTEVVFTSCGSEGNNSAIRSAVATMAGRRRIITTAVEHPCVLNVCRQLEKEGYDLVVIGVDGHGQLDLVQLAEALRTPTALVSTMAANNETGVTFPLEQIAQLVKVAGALWHVDAVQMVGKAPIDLRSLPVDLLTLSAHKIHGPKGVGALYLRRGVRFQPFLLGGHQERGRRAGTENVAGVVGLGQAASEAREALQTGAIAAVGVLRDRLEVGLQALIDDCVVNGVGTSRLANTSNIGFKYIEGESILFSLDSFGICASSGSACTSGSLEASHVLRAMAVPYTTLHGSIRFSLSRFTTAEEVDRVLELMPAVVQRLRDLSPFSDDDMAWLKQMELAPTNPKE